MASDLGPLRTFSSLRGGCPQPPKLHQALTGVFIAPEVIPVRAFGTDSHTTCFRPTARHTWVSINICGPQTVGDSDTPEPSFTGRTRSGAHATDGLEAPHIYFCRCLVKVLQSSHTSALPSRFTTHPSRGSAGAQHLTPYARHQAHCRAGCSQYLPLA